MMRYLHAGAGAVHTGMVKISSTCSGEGELLVASQAPPHLSMSVDRGKLPAINGVPHLRSMSEDSGEVPAMASLLEA